MFILGHVGITVGAGLVVDLALRKKYGSAVTGTSTVTGKVDTAKKPPTANPHMSTLAKLSVFMRHMDYRLLIIGSMLPDIIDKPLGHIFFTDFFDNQGRLFAHSLLFLVIMAAIGLLFYRRWRQRWLLILSFGTAVHIITDEMWLSPHTALWPFLGWSFEKDYAGGNWWTDLWNSFTQASPYVIATETTGVVLLIVFLFVMVRRKKLYSFIRYGRL